MPSPDAATIAAMLRQSLAAGQQPVVTITSNSMAPLLHSGDQIVIAPIDWRALQPGDIVMVEAPGTLLTHRFYGTVDYAGTRCLLLRGDRPLGFDRPLPVQYLIGHATARVRQRSVSLVVGRGRRVSKHLAALARLESRMFQGRDPAHAGTPDLSAPHLGLGARALRRLIYYWASLVTAQLSLAWGSARADRRQGKESL